MRRHDLRLRLEELYRQYEQRFVTPDPLEFVRAQGTDADPRSSAFSPRASPSARSPRSSAA
jgi:hypothetical protein